MAKTRVNLYVEEALLREARDSGLNISGFVEEKLTEHARSTRQQRWLDENREAMRGYNERVERDGPWNRDLINF